jgi:Mg2+-importing ATPase
MPMLLAALSVVAIGAVLPFTPLTRLLGFRPLPSLFFFALAGIVACYLALIELGKYWFYRLSRAPATPGQRQRTPGHRVQRRAARFATHSLRGHFDRRGRGAAVSGPRAVLSGRDFRE